ncbi:MAG: putative glycoside hydrolase, partial [Pseudoxanthomonas sp.]
GKLSYSWPRSAAQSPVNAGQGGTPPQFAYGHGLRYGQDGNLAALSEDPGLDLSALQSARYFEKGGVAKGWRLRLNHASAPVYMVRAGDAPDAGITVAAVDHKAQEDAWRYVWKGPGISSVAFVAPGPLDLSRETNGDVLLVMTMRIESAPAADTALFVECGDKCAGRVPVGAQLAKLPANQWMSVALPLKCFASAGANMAGLTVPAGIESSQGSQLAISEVGYGTVADHVLACEAP